MSATEAALRESVQQYGQHTLSQQDQIKILHLILEDTKANLTNTGELHTLITACQQKLNSETELKKAIEIVNLFLIDLEQKDKQKKTITYLKNHGFYRIIYHNPQIMGQELPPNDSLRNLLRNGFVGVAASALIILLFAATAFFAAPFWLTAIATGLFVGASVYLSGIVYGVVNDLFATHANLPYFLLGHQPQQKSLLRTNDKVAQGIAWGVAATYGPVVLATIVFTVAATITAFFVPMATFILPAMMIAMPLIAIGAEFYARKKAFEYLEFLSQGGRFESRANDYQREGLNYMCPNTADHATWHANSDRNHVGFTKVPLVGVVALVSLLVLSGVSVFLPALLFASPVIAIAIPAAFAATACVGLMAAGVYMYINRNKQVDDRYRLEFDRASIEPNLYLDEDRSYIDGLVKTHGIQGTTIEAIPSDGDKRTFSSIFTTIPAPAIPGELDNNERKHPSQP